MDKKRLTASEMETLLRMKAASIILKEIPEKMAQRSDMVPCAKRDFAMLAAKVQKLHDAFIETIPENQISTYNNNLWMCNFSIGVKRPVNTLLEGCHDHCTMCNLDKGQRRACKLKKAMDILPNDVPRYDENDCPYYTVI